LDWDARRFQTLYAAFVKRKAAEELEKQKLALMTGIWGNSNYDPQKEGEEGARPKFIEALESDVNKKIAILYGMAPPQEEEFEINPNDPFWSAMYRGLEKMHGTAKPTKEEVDRAIADMESPKSSIDVDQIEE
jgi:hypothetical protein